MKINNRNKTKFIVKEIFIGEKPAVVVLSELVEQKSRENVWTSENPEAIMNSTTVKSDSCCSSFRR